MIPTVRHYRRVLVAGALAAGVCLGAAGVAAAATGSTTSPGASSSSSTASTPSGSSAGTPPAGVPGGDPAAMAHGPNESLLTGVQLQEATSAAMSAVPGAAVVRAETNSSGASPYEVHMKKSDGSYVTVDLDASFKEMSTIDGFGGGPAAGATPTGPTPNSTSSN